MSVGPESLSKMYVGCISQLILKEITPQGELTCSTRLEGSERVLEIVSFSSQGRYLKT